MKKAIYDQIKNHSFNLGLYKRDIRLGEIASWAIWDKSNYGDTSIIETSVETINPNIVFVALNFGGVHLSIIDTEDWEVWQNFHSNSSMDKHLCNTLSGTRYEGAYLTDLFKCLPTSDETVLKEQIKAGEIDIEKQVQLFFDEISLLDSSNLEIILMGNATERFFNDYFKEHLNNNYKGTFTAKKIGHPSPLNRYRENMRNQLGIK